MINLSILSNFKTDVCSINAKIKYICDKQNITYQKIADGMIASLADGASSAKRFLNCAEPNGIELDFIKVYLGMEYMPFTENDVKSFHELLYTYRDAMLNGRINDAENLRERAKVIKDFPFEPKLTLMYYIFETLEQTIQPSEKNTSAFLPAILEDYKPLLYELNDAECNYHFARVNGYIKFTQGFLELASENYKHALEISKANRDFAKDDFTLHYNRALCFSRLDQPYLAIESITSAYKDFKGERNGLIHLHADCILALNYIRINEMQEAKDLLEQILVQSVALGNEDITGDAYMWLGVLNRRSGKYYDSINYHTRASRYINYDSMTYLENLFQLCRSTLASGDIAAFRDLMIENESLFTRNPTYNILFTALDFAAKIKTEGIGDCIKAIEYIEKTAIPHLLKISNSFETIDLCTTLIKHYKETNNAVKTLEIYETINNINDKMFYRNVSALVRGF